MSIRYAWVVVLLLMTVVRVTAGPPEPPQTPAAAETSSTVAATPSPIEALQETPPQETPKKEKPKQDAPKPQKAPEPQPAPVTTASTEEKPAPVADDHRLAVNAAMYAAMKASAAQTAADAARLNANATRMALTTTIAPIAAAGAVLSLGTVVLLSLLLFRRKRASRPRPEEELLRRLAAIAAKLETALQLLEGKLQKTSDALQGRLFLTPEHLVPISASVAQVRDEIVRIGNGIERITITDRPPAQTDPVALEREVLRECWKSFRANPELSAAYDKAAKDSTWDLARELTKLVPGDLKPTFDAVLTPWKEHHILVQKIGYVPRLVDGDVERLPTEAEEVRRTREFADLLRHTQSSPDAAGRLTFRIRNWVTDTFLPFADLYLQRYQQARLENRHAELQPGVTLVRQLLRIAAVEPIEVTPGETPFDSTRHIGRSTTNDHRFADGVITGVVRNGFIEGGQQVIRQPEVIVNRR